MVDRWEPSRLLQLQAMVHGVTLALLLIPGNSIFLKSEGAGRLPFVYLGVAVAGIVASTALTRLQARLGVARLAVITAVVLAAVIAAAWFALAVADRPVASYAVLIALNVQAQLGFAFIGAQAGRVLDVQQIKVAFPRIVAAYILGFMIGGGVATPLTWVLGEPVHLIAVAVVTLLGFGGLIARATATFAASSPADERPPEDAQSLVTVGSQSLLQLLRVPLIGAVFGYQVLSTMGTQLVEWLLYERAAARFEDAAELAAFFGTYAFGLNLVELVVLLVAGGFLMTRYGLRFGVAVNPVLVTLLVAASLVAARVDGLAGGWLFISISLARVADATMADVATRTSVNATFQALPQQQRSAAQLAVDGAGGPVALGLTAGMLLLLNAGPGVDVIGVLRATAVVCLLWCVAALVLYGRYRRGVVDAVQRSLLGGPSVDVDEPSTFTTLLSIVTDGEAAAAIRALRLLDRVQDDRLTEALAATTDASGDAAPELLSVAVTMLADRAPARALPAALRCAASVDGEERLAGLRALAVIAGPEAARVLRDATEHECGQHRAAAIGGLLQHAATADSAWLLVFDLAASASVDDRVCAAGAIGEAGGAGREQALAMLLGDPSSSVRSAAAVAVARLGPDRQVDVLAALMASGAGPGLGLFLRNCDLRADSPVGDALALELPHLDAAVRDLGLRRLSASGWTADENAATGLLALADSGLAHIATADAWLMRCVSADGGHEAAALRRALIAERAAGRARLLGALGPLAGTAMVRRAWGVLEGDQPGDVGLALESLEVTLPRSHRATVLAGLRTVGASPPLSSEPLVEDVQALAEDVSWADHADWLQACALDVLRSRAVTPPHDLVLAGPIAAELANG